MIHEVTFADSHGRLSLAEFLRLAGLVAAGVADADDLAHVLAINEATLVLTAQECRNTQAVTWYEASYDCYRAWMAADEVRNNEDRISAVESALADYRELLKDAARWLDEVAKVTAVPRVARPVRGARHLRVVR